MNGLYKISGKYYIDFAEWTVTNGLKITELTKTKKVIFEAFLTSKNIVLSKDTLVRVYAGDDYYGDTSYEQNLRDYISKMRKIIGDDRDKTIIKTVRGEGYQFCGEVVTIREETEENPKREMCDEYIIEGDYKFFESLFSEAESIKTLKIMGKTLDGIIARGKYNIVEIFNKCNEIEIILIDPESDSAIQELVNKSRGGNKADTFKNRIAETIYKLEDIVQKTNKIIEIGFLPFVPYFGYFFIKKKTYEEFYIEIFHHNDYYKNPLLKMDKEKMGEWYSYYLNQIKKYHTLWGRCRKERWSWNEEKNEIVKEKL